MELFGDYLSEQNVDDPRITVMFAELLDEVTGDMRLEYPGKNPFRPDSTYPEQVLRRPELRYRTD